MRNDFRIEPATFWLSSSHLNHSGPIKDCSCLIDVIVLKLYLYFNSINTISGSIPVHGHFAAPFSKEFNLPMLMRAAIVPPRWPGELSGDNIS